jgi:hypothetical protein
MIMAINTLFSTKDKLVEKEQYWYNTHGSKHAFPNERQINLSTRNSTVTMLIVKDISFLTKDK